MTRSRNAESNGLPSTFVFHGKVRLVSKDAVVVISADESIELLIKTVD